MEMVVGRMAVAAEAEGFSSPQSHHFISFNPQSIHKHHPIIHNKVSKEYFYKLYVLTSWLMRQ